MLESVCFNCDYFIENYHPGNIFLFCMLCEFPQENHFTTISEASMVYDLEDASFRRHISLYERFYVIEGIWRGKDYLRGILVS